MVKSLKTSSLFDGLKYSCAGAVRGNKWKLIIITAFILLGIGVGIFVAVKYNSNCELYQLREINLQDFYSGFTASSSAFLSRSLSLLVNVILVVLLSFSPFLFPFACALFVFRAYLFGLNFTLIFVFYGIGSLFTAVIIILPCQLLTLFVMVIFYLLLCQLNHNCKRFGGAGVNRFVFILVGFISLIFLNLVETILLCLLSGRVILVI